MKEKFYYIKQFFGGYYHQDVWEDFEEDFEVWNQYVLDSSGSTLELILKEIKDLLSQNDKEIMEFLDKATSFGGIGFENSTEAKEFLTKLLTFINSNSHK